MEDMCYERYDEPRLVWTVCVWTSLTTTHTHTPH